MREILISTHTRHRDVNDPLYMRDWTAQDVKHIAPEGYYTSNKWRGAKRMGVVLLIPDDVPFHFNKWKDPEADDPEAEIGSLWRRTIYWIDLAKLVDDGKLKDLYNHDLLVDPIVVNKSYLELFKSFEDRPVILSPHDRQGSFTSGTISIGPGGDPDANTILEFESNIANLTGALTGDVNEAFTETTALYFGGWETGAHQFTLHTTGAGRHEGKYTEAKHLISATGTCLKIADANITNAIVEGIITKQTSTGANFSGRYGCDFRKCIGKLTHNDGKGLYNLDTGESWNCVLWGPGAGATNYGFKYGAAKNCTSYGFGDGFSSIATTNCVARSADDDFLSCSGDYNASDDGAPGGNSIDISGSSDAQIWTNVGAGDFSLVVGSPLRGEGQDLSGTFTEDINSVTRSAWDIGAWEYAAGGANYNVAATLAASFGTSQSGMSTALASLTITNYLGISNSAIAAAFSGLTLSQILSISQAVLGGDRVAFATLSNVLSIEQSALAVTLASITYSSDYAISQSASAAALATLTVSFVNGINQIGISAVSATLTLAIQSGINISVVADRKVALSLAAEFGVSSNAQAEAEAGLTLDQLVGIALTGKAIALAGLTLSNILSIEQTAATTLTRVTTPDERTFTITVESRHFTVEEENRYFLVPEEDRHFKN